MQRAGDLTGRCLRVLAERRKALEAERQKVLAEKETARQVEMVQAKERAVTMNEQKIHKKASTDLAAMQTHYEKVMNHRLQEQQELMQAGFKKQADEFLKLIADLESRKPVVPDHKPGWLKRFRNWLW